MKKVVINKIKQIPKLEWVRFIRVKEPYIIARLFYEQWRDEIKKQMGVNFSFLRSRTQIDGHCGIETDFFKFVEVIEKGHKKDSHYLERLFRLYVNAAKSYIRFTKKVKKLPLKNCSNYELKNYFLKYVVEAYKKTGVFIYLPLAAEIILVREIYNWLLENNFDEETIDHLFSIVGKVNKEGYSYYETKDLKKIFNLWKKKKYKFDNEIQKEINKFVEKWGWRRYFRNFEGEQLRFSDVIKQLKEFTERKDPLLEFKKEKVKNLLNLKSVFKKIKAPSSLRRKINLLRDYIWMRSKGRDDITLGQWQVMPILSEIAKRLKISINDISWLDHREIVDYLKDSQYLEQKSTEIKRIIKDRQRGYVIFFVDNNEYVLTGEFFQKFIRKEKELPFASFLQGGWFKKEKTIKSYLNLKNYLTGRVACSGFTRGKVKVIYTKDDLPKIQKGDILVTEATVPDYVPAMRKASAIITDLGGLTSHAAIVSRELKIPCIIGTKIATKVLKDGQLVEVDATKGIVKILKKTKR